MTLAAGRGGRVLTGCLAFVAAAGFLSGCAPSNNGLQRETATQLQARVLEVTAAASQNDPATALKALEGLESDLSAAQSKGQVSEERRRSITTVATAVRADLNDILAAQQAAAKAAQDAPGATGQPTQDTPPAPQAPVSQAAPAPGPGNAGDAGKNNSDKGKGKN